MAVATHIPIHNVYTMKLRKRNGPIGLWDVGVSTFFLDGWLTDGGKVISPVRRQSFTPQE
jgi:hypothetical protein